MADDNAPWFVLWTRSHCEQLVHDQVAAHGFCAFLPTIRTWSRRKGARPLEFLGSRLTNAVIETPSL